jgi:hypothetical protein
MPALNLCSSIVLALFFLALNAQGPDARTLRNVNPDPNGEPWLVGAMEVTPDVLKKVKNIPAWPAPVQSSTLPDHVYNYRNPEFPPTFSQIGGCCSAASGIGYCYTYETNVLRQVSATSADNLCAYGFIYDIVNGGADNGIWYYDAWETTKKTGCVSKTDFGNVLEDDSHGLKESKWANGYLKYHNAFSQCVDSSYYIIKVGTDSGLTRLKQWMFDHGRGDKKGGVAVFSWIATHYFSTIPAGMPDAGKKILTSIGSGDVTEHAMTFAGYDDRIGPSSSELGAVLLQNSWGNSYGDSGRCWVPYKFLQQAQTGIYNNQVYVIDVRKHQVKADYKISITHNQRNQIQLMAGLSNSPSAAAPTTSAAYNKWAFNYSGGAWPMEGNGGSSTLEIGLDVSDYYGQMTGNQATFFLIINSKGGTGTINSFSLMDYSGDSVKEIPCPQTNVAIATGKTTLSITYTKPPVAAMTPAVASRIPADIRISADRGIYLPLAGHSTVMVRDLRGRLLHSFEINGSGWHSMPSMVPGGTYIISVKNHGMTYENRLNFVKR